MLIRNPYTCGEVALTDLYVVEDVSGYCAVLSPEGWFSCYLPTASTAHLDTVPGPARKDLEESIRVAERGMVNEAFAAMVRGVTLSNVDERAQPDNTNLKAIFMAGPGGAGKSAVTNAMFAGTGMKFIDSDRHFERMLKAAAVPLRKAGSAYDLFNRARDLARIERDHYAKARLGLTPDPIYIP